MRHIRSSLLSLLLCTTSLWSGSQGILSSRAIAQQWQPPVNTIPSAPSSSAALSNPAVLPPQTTFRQREGGLCPNELSARINQIVSRPAFSGARWGILVEPLSSTTPIYSLNADDWLIPASNNKLFTTAAALQTFDYSNTSSFTNLKAWITEINRFSDNNYADSLLRRIGGPAVARDVLLKMGIDPSFQQVDGSGLSRSNRAKPKTLVALLQTMQTNDNTGIFYDSLSVAGVSGTLRNRFHNTLVEGRLRGKTGTLNGVRALSGYLETNDYGPLVLSILVNQPGQYGDTLVSAIDQIVVQISKLTVCN